jgi:hypothetical protein
VGANLLLLLWGKQTFIALKVHRLCPLVLPIKLGWREGALLGSEEGKVTRSGLILQQRKEAEIVR